jgi:hypothetical protein
LEAVGSRVAGLDGVDQLVVRAGAEPEPDRLLDRLVVDVDAGQAEELALEGRRVLNTVNPRVGAWTRA